MTESRHDLRDEQRALETLIRVADVVHRSLDLEIVARRAVRAVVEYAPYGGAAVVALDPDGRHFRLLASRGFSERVVEAGRKLPVEGSMMGQALELRRLMTSDDLATESRGLPEMRAALLQEGFRRAITVPLIHQEERLGALNIVLTRESPLGEREREILESVGRTIAVAMANARHVAQIEAEVEKRREIERRYMMATAAARVGVWDWDTNSGTFYIDPTIKAMLGYADNEIRNDLDAWLEHVHPEDRDRVRDAVRAQLRGETYELALEHRMLHRDGSVRWILARGSTVRDEDGRPTRLLGTSVDITDRKRLEEERRTLELEVLHAEKLKSLGVLAGGIAHDFNNLLTSVIGNADLALRHAPKEGAIRTPLERVETAARRASELTRQLLAYSGKGTIVLRPVDLRTLVTEMADLLEVSVAKTAHLRFEFADSVPAVEGDPTQLRQVVMNLITNASEALDGKTGDIMVRIGSQHGQVALEVEDQGCGMDPVVQKRIFDPFFSTKFSGRGLGLAAVQGIVREHGGTIEVESEPAQGTRIRMLLPPTDRTATRAAPAPDAPATVRAGGTVLVVDDEEIVRTLARTALEAAGFSVITARDGVEGLDEFRKRRDEVRLVLLDVTMPRMGGQDTFREMRRIRPDACIILSSGYRAREAIESLEGEGLAGFLEKPYKLSRLLDEVRTALRR